MTRIALESKVIVTQEYAQYDPYHRAGNNIGVVVYDFHPEHDYYSIEFDVRILGGHRGGFGNYKNPKGRLGKPDQTLNIPGRYVMLVGDLTPLQLDVIAYCRREKSNV